jgi:hypothetical protein
LDIFCFRLSLLDGRVGLSPSASFIEGLLEFGVVPRASFELEAMVWGFGELLVACEDVMDEGEFLERATAGGVCDGRGSMAASSTAKRDKRWCNEGTRTRSDCLLHPRPVAVSTLWCMQERPKVSWREV